MTATAQGSINHVKEVRVSEGSRGMARPANHNVLSFIEEWDRLSAEKTAIQAKLAAYKGQVIEEQTRIRRGNGDTLKAWMRRKAEMESERYDAITRMNWIENRLREIKPRVRDDQHLLNSMSIRSVDPAESIKHAQLTELQAIRGLLEQLVAHFAVKKP